MAERSSVTAAQVLDRARQLIGVTEDPKYSNRVRFNDQLVDAGYYPESFRVMQWCGAFVSCVFIDVGGAGNKAVVPLCPVFVYTPSGLAWFQSRALVTQGSHPRVGDVLFVHYPNTGAIVGHTGLVEWVNGNRFGTIEGNSNTDGSASGYEVARVTRTVSDRYYFAHPQYAPEGDSVALSAADIDKIATATKDKLMSEVVYGAGPKGSVLKSSLRNNAIWWTIWADRAQQKLDRIIKKLGA